jgi:ABC-type multidrug transport system fused ATPase/permease subunit
MLYCAKMAWRIRQGIIGGLFTKLLVLNTGAKNAFSGRIINMMTTDVQYVRGAGTTAVSVSILPFQLAVAVALLVQLLGVSAIIGVLCMACCVPCTKAIVKRMSGYQKSVLVHTDARIKHTLEAMSNPRVIKSHCWEDLFRDKIIGVRSRELRVRRNAAIMQAAMDSVAAAAPIITIVVTLGSWTLLFGHELTASIAFPALALLDILRLPLAQLPGLITQALQTWLSAGRINRFLNAEGVLGADDHRNATAVDRGAVSISSAAYSWPLTVASAWDDGEHSKQPVATPPPVLRDMHLQVQPGHFCFVVGRVGSGKTSLLHAILGELDTLQGDTSVGGRLSYAAQSAFLQPATLRENILFGAEYSEPRYSRVIHACALEADLATFPAGDATQVGERGITLSGGQKQRVGLARCIYQDADVYLLDDPLSAVDAHVAQHLMEFVVCGMLREGRKTVVMPCLTAAYLGYADWIVAMDDGCIAEQGKYDQLMQIGGYVSSIVYQHTKSHEKSSKHHIRSRGGPKPDQKADSTSKDAIPAEPLIGAELRSRGAVRGQEYLFYLKQWGCLRALAVAVAFVCSQLGLVFRDWWLSRWATPAGDDNGVGYELSERENRTGEAQSAAFLTVYSVAAVVVISLTALQAIVVQLVGLGIGRKLHEKMLWTMLRARLEFYDRTPLGRILNRFTTDVLSVDGSIASGYAQAFSAALNLLSSFVVVSVVMPWFVLLLIPVTALYLTLAKYYRNAARESRRITSLSKSNVFACFIESLDGLVTIRALQAGARFQAVNVANNDAFLRPMMTSVCLNFWLACMTELIAATLLLAVVLGVTLWPDSLDAGLAGLVIAYSLAATTSLRAFIDSGANLELLMNSVERVREYLAVPSEAAREAPGAAPASWPARGQVALFGVCARYRPELARALEDVCVLIPAGATVGICGRTGSGKSTLMSLMLRLLEVDAGWIEIVSS